MEEGTLFSNPEPLGPTVLVFVGRGRVRIDPGPKAEREQLRRFSGAPALDVPVKWCFVRLHPADFDRLIDTIRLEPDPDAATRLRAGAADLRRALGPQLRARRAAPGLALVAAAERRRRGRRFPVPARARADLRALRGRGGGREPVRPRSPDPDLRVPSAARAAQPSRSRRRSTCSIRSSPSASSPSGSSSRACTGSTLGSVAATTLRLRLDDDFRVSSVSSDGRHRAALLPCARARQHRRLARRDRASATGRSTVVTRYAGRHDPAPIDHELLQVARVHGDFSPRADRSARPSSTATARRGIRILPRRPSRRSPPPSTRRRAGSP